MYCTQRSQTDRHNACAAATDNAKKVAESSHFFIAFLFQLFFFWGGGILSLSYIYIFTSAKKNYRHFLTRCDLFQEKKITYHIFRRNLIQGKTAQNKMRIFSIIILQIFSQQKIPGALSTLTILYHYIHSPL